MESENENDPFEKEQIMPDGILEFVTHFNDPWITTVAGKDPELQPDSFIISQMRKYIEIESSGFTGLISVRFFPWGGYHFFDEPVNHFIDDTIPIQKLWPQQADDFINKVRTAPNHEARSTIVQEFLLERLSEFKNTDNKIDESVQLIRKSKGKLSINEVLEKTGLSKKQLERKFIPTVGTTPKAFARISRFLNICHHLEDNKNKSLTELTYECGYFDQAHFIKEFKEFSGFTPKEYFAKNNVGFADI